MLLLEHEGTHLIGTLIICYMSSMSYSMQYDILTYILMSYNLISQLVLLLFITNVSEVWAKFVSGCMHLNVLPKRQQIPAVIS